MAVVAEWPRPAGGLADWSPGSEAQPLRIADLRDRLRIEADQPFAAGAPARRRCPDGDTPGAQGQVLAMEPVGARALACPRPMPGQGSTASCSPTTAACGSSGTCASRVTRRAPGRESGTGRVAGRGLASTWNPRQLRATGDGVRARRPLDRSPLVLGLLLCLAGIVVAPSTGMAHAAALTVRRRRRRAGSSAPRRRVGRWRWRMRAVGHQPAFRASAARARPAR